jgi:hypothetical protein
VSILTIHIPLLVETAIVFVSILVISYNDPI